MAQGDTVIRRSSVICVKSPSSGVRLVYIKDVKRETRNTGHASRLTFPKLRELASSIAKSSAKRLTQRQQNGNDLNGQAGIHIPFTSHSDL